MKFSALCYFTILQVAPLVLCLPTIQEKSINNTSEFQSEPLKSNHSGKNITGKNSEPMKLDLPNPAVLHLLNKIPKVLSKAEIADAQDDYPTDTELLLFVYCLNNRFEPSCAVFFRFAHYLFAGRVKTDPLLASVVEQEDEVLNYLTATKYYSYSDIVYNTIEITEDVITEVDVTITYYETDSEKYYSNHPTGAVGPDQGPLETNVNQGVPGEINNPSAPTNSITCPTQFITETITATNTVTHTIEPSAIDFDCKSLASNTKAISCMNQNGFIQLDPIPTSCNQLKNYIGIYEPVFSSCFADSTKTVDGPTITVTKDHASTLTVAVYSTVTEGPVKTVYTGKASTIYTGSISTITATPTTIGAPVSTLTETSISTLTVGVYTTVTEEPGHTITATPTVIGAPATTITDLEPVTVFTGSITTITVGVYTTVTKGPVSTIYTGKVSTITTGPVTTVTASPPTIIAGPATTVTLTSVPESTYPAGVCTTITRQPTKTVYTGNVTTIYTDKATTIFNDAPAATFTQYVPLVNFNMIPGGGFIDNLNGNFMAGHGDAGQSPGFIPGSGGSVNIGSGGGLGRSLGNGNTANDGPFIGSNDTPKNASGEISVDNLKDIFGSDFVNEHGDLFGKILAGSNGHIPKDGYGGGVYQNEGSIINDGINMNNTNPSSVHNNGSESETVPDNNREIVIQNIFNNFYGGSYDGEYDGEIPGYYVNFKGERAWSSPFGLYFDNGTRLTFYTNCSFTGNIPRSLLLKDEGAVLEGESESSMMFASIDHSTRVENPSIELPISHSYEYELTQYYPAYPTFCTDDNWEEEIIGDPVDCIITTVTHPPDCSQHDEWNTDYYF